MKTQYSGLVIGGVGAGKAKTIGSPYLRLATPPSLELLFSAPSLELSAGVECYKHRSFYFRNDDTGQDLEFSFWIPDAVKDGQAFIMEQLIEGYVKSRESTNAE